MNEEKEPPSKCEFCGRDLILYKDNWICGHGCMKPAVKPKEPTPSKCDKSPNGKHQFQGGHGLYYCRYCDKKWSREPPEDKNLMETAKTTKIILVFDNGHEHVLEPEKYKIVETVDLELMIERGSSGNYGAWKDFWNQIEEKYIRKGADAISKTKEPTPSEQREFPFVAFAVISGLLISAWTIFLMIIGFLL